MKILVVGATGMLGAPVAQRLLKDGFDVRVLARTPEKARALFDPAVEVVSLPLFVRGKKAFVFGRQPNPWHWLAADDFAAMVSRAYRTPESAGQTLDVLGPSPARTMREALELYCRIVAPGTTVKQMPLGVLRLIATLSFSPRLRLLVGLMRYFEQTPEEGSPEPAWGLLGAPTTTLDVWCDKLRKGEIKPLPRRG